VVGWGRTAGSALKEKRGAGGEHERHRVGGESVVFARKTPAVVDDDEEE
jgi:hypothetical protein